MHVEVPTVDQVIFPPVESPVSDAARMKCVKEFRDITCFDVVVVGSVFGIFPFGIGEIMQRFVIEVLDSIIIQNGQRIIGKEVEQVIDIELLRYFKSCKIAVRDDRVDIHIVHADEKDKR